MASPNLPDRNLVSSAFRPLALKKPEAKAWKPGLPSWTSWKRSSRGVDDTTGK